MNMYQIGIVGMGKNGFMNQIMQSQQDTDTLIQDFEAAIAAGYNPNDIKQQIFEARGMSEDDLTYNDKQRLIKKIEAAWKSHEEEF